eukprot:768013-Hanusia_phi.AAC.17
MAFQCGTASCNRDPGHPGCYCDPGYTGPMGTRNCTLCAAGFFKPSSGPQECTACTNKPPNSVYIGEISPVSSSCEWVCAAGYYYTMGSCLPCEAGKYSVQGSSSCAVCPDGFYSTPHSSSCSPCPKGTFSLSGFGTCFIAIPVEKIVYVEKPVYIEKIKEVPKEVQVKVYVNSTNQIPLLQEKIIYLENQTMISPEIFLTQTYEYNVEVQNEMVNRTNVTLNINGEDCQAEVSRRGGSGERVDGGGGRYGTWTGRST